jgi:hypothetical protein
LFSESRERSRSHFVIRHKECGWTLFQRQNFSAARRPDASRKSPNSTCSLGSCTPVSRSARGYLWQQPPVCFSARDIVAVPTFSRVAKSLRVIRIILVPDAAGANRRVGWTRRCRG